MSRLIHISIIVVALTVFGSGPFAFVVDSAPQRTAWLLAAPSDDEETPTPTDTPVPPTATDTSVSPNATNTPITPPATNTPIPPTATNTPIPPTATNTLVPPTATNTPIPPTSTNTPVDTATPTKTATPTQTPAPTWTPPPSATNTAVPPTWTPTPSPTPTNAPPRIDLDTTTSGTGFSTSFRVGGDPVNIVSSRLSIRDADDSGLIWAKIRIKNLTNGNNEKLDASVSGTKIRIQQNGNGFLYLLGDDNLSNYEKVLKTVKYENTLNPPDMTTREISVVVNDGRSNSNFATATVRMVNPKLSVSKRPSTQTIAKGSAAAFTIVLENTGNVALNSIEISDDLAPACSRQLSETLAVGATRAVSCGRNNVNSEFTNVAAVTARDGFGHVVAEQSNTARVEVVNPNIQIVKSPSAQTVERGGTAAFNIFVVNTSSSVGLKNVVVTDPVAPDCDAQIGNLNANTVVEYDCSLAGVTNPLLSEITVTGQNIFSDEVVQDSSIAEVEILDLAVTYSTAPAVVPAEGAPVVFSVEISNPGSVPFTIDEVNDAALGSLANPSNNLLSGNTCLDAIGQLVLAEEVYSCQFTAVVAGAPGAKEYVLTVSAQDEEDLPVTGAASATVEVAGAGLLAATLHIVPASLAAPGGIIAETVTLQNLSPDAELIVRSLEHGELGDLNGVGDCTTPQTVAPAGSYVCTYSVGVEGGLDEIITQTVFATGAMETRQLVGSIAQATIWLFDPAHLLNMMPLVAQPADISDTDNDSPCAAYGVANNVSYEFELEDGNDWYYFEITRAGPVTLELNNIMSPNVQVAVYENETCTGLSADDLVAFNGDNLPDKQLVFYAQSGRHFIWVADPQRTTSSGTYTLIVRTP